MSLSRRTLLKLGIIGAATLASAGGIYRLSRSRASAPFILTGEAQAALQAMIPAILKDALPADPAAISTATKQVQDAIASLPLATQKEVQDLFALLAFVPARRLLAGLENSWEQASIAQVNAFLQSWRTHRFTVLQTAYHALHDLILGAWYADESTWHAIGYPGPIKAFD